MMMLQLLHHIQLTSFDTVCDHLKTFFFCLVQYKGQHKQTEDVIMMKN